MFVRLNTVLIPEIKVQDELVKLAKKVGKHKNALFNIDDKNYFTHLTLYSPEYPEKNVENVIASLDKIANNSKQLVLNFDDFKALYGYLVLMFKKTENIMNLHRKTLKELNPLREGRTRERYISTHDEGKLTRKEIDYGKKYGYHNVLQNYQPHISLARFENNGIAEKVKQKLEKNIIPQKVTFPHLALCKTGPHGTCTEIVKKFGLF